MPNKVTITSKQRDNLLLLAKAVKEDRLPLPVEMATFLDEPGGFALSVFMKKDKNHPCGTTACLIGNAAEMHEFEEYREKVLGDRGTYGQFCRLAFGDLDEIWIDGRCHAGQLIYSHGAELDHDDQIEVWDALFDSDIHDEADHAARIEAVVAFLDREGHVAS